MVFPHGPTLFEKDNVIFKAPVSWAEVKKALFSMQPLKALGLDGFQPGFYQIFRDKVELSTFNFITSCMLNGNFPTEFNKFFITLVPKIDNLETIINFRPITLFNVAYKILTKMFVHIIRPMLDKIVGPCPI